jgi:hypothetical protein
MTEDPSTHGKDPRSVRRVAVGSIVALQLALAIAAFLAGNYLSATHHRNWDLSKNNQYTLSPLTTRLLASDAIQNRERPVRIIAAIRKNSAHHARLRAIGEEYARLSQDAVEIEFVDYVIDTDRAYQIAEAYDYTFVNDVFVIDARTDDDPPPPENTEGEESKAAASPHIRFVPVADMLVYRTDGPNDRPLVGYQDEDLITSSLRSAVEGTPRRFYFLADKSLLQDSSRNTPYDTLATTLRRQNILLTPVRISDIDAIPANAEGLAIVAPQYDFDDRQLSILEEYWARPRSSLLVILDPLHRPEKLRAFLRAHGVSPRNDRILTMRHKQASSRIRATFTFGAQLNSINTDLSGKDTEFEGGTSSLEVREGAPDLLNRRIFPIALIETGLGHWGETRFTEENPVFNPAEDFGNPAPGAAPLYLAAGVIRGNATDDRTADQVSRMVVIANSSFLHPQRIRAEQVDFLRNGANWLIGREDLIGIGPRPVQRYKLNLVASQVTFVNRLNVFLIPAALLLLGLFIWSLRRA